ncbi:IS110 family transposase [Staphylococcus gallinarum]|uniref:transposase n=1 Tax=Staphylococcus gallinarum TaxID=1293 RepID=UPI002DBED9DF|nr:transposase [Staphylococcus gallinarum]MEB6238783.1 IS110 family transposase [Staphylococcus gallinarum]
MSVFLSDKNLCSWAGLTPQNNESAGKKKSVRISRAGVYIKPLLVQCANAVIRSKTCPYSVMTKSRNGGDTRKQLLQLPINYSFVFTICLIKMSLLTKIYTTSIPNQSRLTHPR